MNMKKELKFSAERFKPEGCLINTVENQRLIGSEDGLREAMERGIILEAVVSVCDSSHNLLVDLPCMKLKGLIPREDGALGIKEGITRDIALIARVNKPVAFKVKGFIENEDGESVAMLSRSEAQQECQDEYISNLCPGSVIDARVTHLEQFGCFVDIGCGIPSLIPIDSISVSRISHPSDRFCTGLMIKAVVKENTGGRVCLSHKELLGTWEENASEFQAGETVAGIVRSVEEYGIFVELTPNLAGLAEPKPNIKVGDNVSVYIKALIPEKMKVKLIIVDVCEKIEKEPSCRYHYNGSFMESWLYTPPSSDKIIETLFVN